ncbi:Nicotinamide phosphoribosyltransferase, partial [Smittium mucronatum]
MFGLSDLPPMILTDAYKLSHYRLYPEARSMTAYGEFRTSLDKDQIDHRIVFYGIQYIIKNYVSRKWTLQDLAKTKLFLKTFNALNSEYPFPEHLFEKFIAENDGYFPVVIEALPEGSVIYPRVPVFQITAKNEYSSLVTFLETVLTMVWYPSTVATLSRRAKTLISKYFDETVDPPSRFLIDSRLHDFGFRGCTSIEQSVIGGCAHLLNFEGTDTMSAAYYAQFELNGGKPVGNSIPATEHSVMTSYNSELDSIKKALEEYGSGLVSIVMDSYDYKNALENLLPAVKSLKLKKGGILVIRPDSGDVVTTVIDGLIACDRVFGSIKNELG